MKCNWDVTENNNKVAINNYYGRKPMAVVYIWTPWSGVLGRWWTPVEHKEKYALKLIGLASKLHANISIGYPLPDVEEAKGMELFKGYTYASFVKHSKAKV